MNTNDNKKFKDFLNQVMDIGDVNESNLNILHNDMTLFVCINKGQHLRIIETYITDIDKTKDYPFDEITLELTDSSDGMFLGRFNLKSFNVFKELPNHGKTFNRMFFSKKAAQNYVENVAYILDTVYESNRDFIKKEFYRVLGKKKPPSDPEVENKK